MNERSDRPPDAPSSRAAPLALAAHHPANGLPHRPERGRRMWASGCVRPLSHTTLCPGKRIGSGRCRSRPQRCADIGRHGPLRDVRGPEALFACRGRRGRLWGRTRSADPRNENFQTADRPRCRDRSTRVTTGRAQIARPVADRLTSRRPKSRRPPSWRCRRRSWPPRSRPRRGDFPRRPD